MNFAKNYSKKNFILKMIPVLRKKRMVYGKISETK